MVRLLSIGLASMLLMLFNNCDGVQTPNAVRGLASVSSFSHAGITSNCASCHGQGKTFDAFPTVGHIDIGSKDCSSCHNTNAWFGGTTSPHVAGATIPSTCVSCHAADRPTGLVGTASLLNNITPVGGFFNHAAVPAGQGDCVTCHTANPTNVGVTFNGGVYSHNPMPNTCIACHTSVHRPVGPVGNPSFDHANGGTGDCVTCHNNPANVGRSWQQSKFTHSPTPTACITCHAKDPTFTAIQSIIKNQMAHTFPGIPDCARCHTTAAQASAWTSWNAENVANGNRTARATLGVFHANFGSTPANCIACHINERPVGPVGTPAFDHANGGTGDCKACHTVAANIGKTWAGGQFSHTGITSCKSCHASRVPNGTVPNTRVGFNHDPKYGTECASCHTVVAANVGTSWSKGFFGHLNNQSSAFASCSPCHDTYEHKAGTNCAKCHGITWPKANATGVYSGRFN